MSDDAFEAVFVELFPRAFRLAFRILGGRAAAEDIAAEALARTYVAWPRVRHLAWRDAWVLRVTANLAIDATRRRTAAPAPSVGGDVEEIATLRVALVQALRALPRRQRQIVALRHLSGLSETEVAAALGISVGSVKAHAHRGIAALRARLGPDAEGVTTFVSD